MSEASDKNTMKILHRDDLTYDILIEVREPSLAVSPQTRAMLDRHNRERREARARAGEVAPAEKPVAG